MEVSTRLTKLLNALHDICALGQPAGQEVPSAHLTLLQKHHLPY